MYGDTEAARKRVSQLREQADDLRAIADRLVAQAEAVPWRGRAAESMRSRIKDRAQHLRATAAHHETAADSLGHHLGEVTLAKETIETRAARAEVLVSDARARTAAGAGGATPDDADAQVLAFEPPPRGHADWLTISLPGL